MALIDTLMMSCADSLRRGDRIASVASYIESDLYKKCDVARLPALRQCVKHLREGSATIEGVALQLIKLATPPPLVKPDEAEAFHREMMGPAAFNEVARGEMVRVADDKREKARVAK